jgi:hypothetical protein
MGLALRTRITIADLLDLGPFPQTPAEHQAGVLPADQSQVVLIEKEIYPTAFEMLDLARQFKAVLIYDERNNECTFPILTGSTLSWHDYRDFVRSVFATALSMVAFGFRFMSFPNAPLYALCLAGTGRIYSPPDAIKRAICQYVVLHAGDGVATQVDINGVGMTDLTDPIILGSIA